MRQYQNFCRVGVWFVMTGMVLFLVYGTADAEDKWKTCKANYIECYTQDADTTQAKCREGCERIYKGDKYAVAACKDGCGKMHDCFLSKRDEVAKRVCASGDCYSTCMEEMNYLLMGCRVVGQPFCKAKSSSVRIPCITGYEYYGISMHQKGVDICPKACPK